MYKAIIFDLDGTLLNTLDDLKNSVNYALNKHNLKERTLKEIRSFVGNGVKLLVQRAIGKELPEEQFNEIFNDFKTHYEVHKMDVTSPYEGIYELLKELKNRNYKLAIVSNKYDQGVKEICKNFFFEFIEVAIGESSTVRPKPAPDAMYEALKQLNVSKDEALFVGDSDVDLETGRNANIKTISVSWGFKDKEFLESINADIIIDNPNELLNYL